MLSNTKIEDLEVLWSKTLMWLHSQYDLITICPMILSAMENSEPRAEVEPALYFFMGRVLTVYNIHI
ncbi:hypothetical protein KIN20_024944 [Parelaphostrongylus tenuis]|uniref:Uncharacterized protein n=1 Tax=Parelaphostrongylus tenuis TaxID=148309 RepID=A0AAD5QX18_PARTN|nr:hypothetical protein KIN20_024944 [Parelaphostrongylus tenuis]